MKITTSPLTWATIPDGEVWFNGPCDSNTGSSQGSLDGGLAPAQGAFLPTGSHTYVMSFSNCKDSFGESYLDGVASAAYNAPEWSNVTAMVSANSVRARGFSLFSRLSDVTADGSAIWTRVGSTQVESTPRTQTYTPATGSRLVNNSTTNVATFGGGSYSLIYHRFLSDNNSLSIDRESQFGNLRVAINGTEYILGGSLDTRTYSGEIRISNNGTLVARIYGDRNARLGVAVEVLVPLVPF